MSKSSPLLVAITITLGVLFACGEVTGLSDDYTFDAGDEGSSGTSSGASGGTDAAPDAPPEAGVCPGSGAALTGGTEACRTCLGEKCCVQVTTCSKVTDCNTRLSCNLDCNKQFASSGSNGAVKDCYNNCTDRSPGAAVYAPVGTCADTSCSQCGFK